jgi:hypothetical protein
MIVFPLIRLVGLKAATALRLGPLYQLHPGRSRSLVRHYDRLHGNWNIHLKLLDCRGLQIR